MENSTKSTSFSCLENAQQQHESMSDISLFTLTQEEEEDCIIAEKLEQEYFRLENKRARSIILISNTITMTSNNKMDSQATVLMEAQDSQATLVMDDSQSNNSPCNSGKTPLLETGSHMSSLGLSLEPQEPQEQQDVEKQETNSLRKKSKRTSKSPSPFKEWTSQSPLITSHEQEQHYGQLTPYPNYNNNLQPQQQQQQQGHELVVNQQINYNNLQQQTASWQKQTCYPHWMDQIQYVNHAIRLLD